MKKVNRAISLIPIMLFLAVVVYNLVFTNIEITKELYLKYYCYGNEVIMATIGVLSLLICRRLNLCWYNKVASFGFLILSIVNILAMITGLDAFTYYNFTTNILAGFIGILAFILLMLRK